MVKLVDYYFYWILVELLAHPKIIFSPQGSRQKEALVLSSSCDWMDYLMYCLIFRFTLCNFGLVWMFGIETDVCVRTTLGN